MHGCVWSSLLVDFPDQRRSERYKSTRLGRISAPIAQSARRAGASRRNEYYFGQGGPYNPLGRRRRGWIIPGALLSGISPYESERGAEDRSPDGAICKAAERGDLNSVRRLHQSGADLRLHDNALLFAACEGGYLDIVRYLHENGVEINARNQELLCRACKHGHLDVVRYLHQNGVPLNAPNQEPLCRACQHGHLDIVRYLHQNGVPLNAHG